MRSEEKKTERSTMEWKLVKKVKPYAGAIFLQFCNAGFSIVAKAALNKGSSHFTFSVYRNAFAAAIFLPFAFILERSSTFFSSLSLICICVCVCVCCSKLYHISSTGKLGHQKSPALLSSRSYYLAQLSN